MDYPFKKSQLPSAAQSILPLGNHLIHPDWCLLLLFAGDDSALCLLSLCDNNPGNQIPLYDAQISPPASPSATYRTTTMTTNPIEQAHLQIPLTRRAPLPTSTNEGDDPLRSRRTVTRDERKAEFRAMLKEEGRIASALERIASALEARPV